MVFLCPALRWRQGERNCDDDDDDDDGDHNDGNYHQSTTIVYL